MNTRRITPIEESIYNKYIGLYLHAEKLYNEHMKKKEPSDTRTLVDVIEDLEEDEDYEITFIIEIFTALTEDIIKSKDGHVEFKDIKTFLGDEYDDVIKKTLLKNKRKKFIESYVSPDDMSNPNLNFESLDKFKESYKKIYYDKMINLQLGSFKREGGMFYKHVPVLWAFVEKMAAIAKNKDDKHPIGPNLFYNYIIKCPYFVEESQELGLKFLEEHNIEIEPDMSSSQSVMEIYNRRHKEWLKEQESKQKPIKEKNKITE